MMDTRNEMLRKHRAEARTLFATSESRSYLLRCTLVSVLSAYNSDLEREDIVTSARTSSLES